MESRPSSGPVERGQGKTYKMRTMEEDLAAQKGGAPPVNIPVSVPVAPRQATPVPELPAAPGRGPASLSQIETGQPGPAEPGPEPIPLESLSSIERAIGPEIPKPPLGETPAAPKPEPPKPTLPLPDKKSRRKLLMLIGAAGLIVLVLIFEVWWFFIRPSGEETPVTTPEELFPAPEATLPPQPEVPAAPASPANQGASAAPLLSYDRAEVLVAERPTEAAIAEAVKKGFEKTYPESSLVFLNLSLDDAGRRRAVSLDELVGALKITVNPGVRSQLTGEYNLFLFSRSPFDRSICDRAGIASADCSGPRLGLAFLTKEGTAIRGALTAWEPSMAQNLQALILAQATIGPGQFLLNDATYKNVPIRYRNFPIDTMTIDYALRGNILLITTSKSSTFAAIDALP